MHPTCLYKVCSDGKCPSCDKRVFKNFRESYVKEHFNPTFPQVLQKEYDTNYNHDVLKEKTALENWKSVLAAEVKTRINAKKADVLNRAALWHSTQDKTDELTELFRLIVSASNLVQDYHRGKLVRYKGFTHKKCQSAIYNSNFRWIDIDCWPTDVLSHFGSKEEMLTEVADLKEWLIMCLGEIVAYNKEEEAGVAFKIKYAEKQVALQRVVVRAAESALDNKTSTIFDTYLNGLMSAFGKETCRVCMDALAEYANMTCGHRMFCKACLTRMDKCPMCQKRITKVMKIFI